jgi:hypothetical protein
VLNAVKTRLRTVSLPGIKGDQIGILPEGKVPASVGQRFLTIHAEQLVTTYQGEWPARSLNFAISIIQRIRDIPNDRFGIIYTDPNGMAATHEAVTDAIVSLNMLDVIDELNSVDTPEGEPATYIISKNFRHTRTNLDPLHLYPSFFLTKPIKGRASPSEVVSETDQLDDKIAGFRTVSYFASPIIRLADNPLSCIPISSVSSS